MDSDSPAGGGALQCPDLTLEIGTRRDDKTRRTYPRRRATGALGWIQLWPRQPPTRRRGSIAAGVYPTPEVGNPGHAIEVGSSVDAIRRTSYPRAMAGGLPYDYQDSRLHERRERVFLVFAGIFLGAMTMLNILGITKFIHVGPLALAVGVLPYPLTFLCTDFISEFYGRRRANFVVWVGLLLNVIVIGFLWLGHFFPSVDATVQPGWQMLHLAKPITLPFGGSVSEIELFEIIFRCTRGAVLASMVAYMAAQFCDVYLFHFWKRVTKGSHLWLRNNGSTMISQLVDATAVIFVTFWTDFSTGRKTLVVMLGLIGSNYLFKVVIAALDTIPFYMGVRWLKGYLHIDPTREPPGTGVELTQVSDEV